MGHEVTVQWDRFNAVLDRRIATSSREQSANARKSKGKPVLTWTGK
jgi:hypothetical protein